MKRAEFILIPTTQQVPDLEGKQGIEVLRMTQRGEVIVEMTPQRAGSLRREFKDKEIVIEPVMALQPA